MLEIDALETLLFCDEDDSSLWLVLFSDGGYDPLSRY